MGIPIVEVMVAVAGLERSWRWVEVPEEAALILGL